MKKEVLKKGELLETLFTLFSELSHKKIKNYLKDGGVLVNGKVVTKYNEIVNKHDFIELSKINKTHKKSSLNIIYEDEYFIAISKKASLLSVSTAKENEKTAYHLIREFVKGRNNKDKVYVLHRLDKDTSGVLVFVKDNNLKNILQNNWNKYVKEREYIAIINKEIEDLPSYTCYLKEVSTDIVAVSSKKEGKLAITSIKTISKNKNYSLIKVNIKTGRRNQIRAVLKHLDRPILGDKKYGGSKADRLYLHARKMVITNPLNNKTYTFISDIPKEFKKGGLYFEK